MNDAALKLAKNAGGDYRQDPNADRFPELKPPAQPDTWVRKVRADRRPDFRGVVFPCPAAEREPDSGAQRPAS